MIFIVSLVVAYNEEHLVGRGGATRSNEKTRRGVLSGADFEWNESARYNRGSKQSGDRGGEIG